MKKLALFVCFIFIAGLAAVEADRYPRDKIKSCKLMDSSTGNKLTDITNKVEEVNVMVHGTDELLLHINFRDGSEILFYCNGFNEVEYNGTRFWAYNAWQEDPETYEIIGSIYNGAAFKDLTFFNIMGTSPLYMFNLELRK